MKYIKPGGEVVDAFQWTGGHDQREDPRWLCEAIEQGNVWFNNPGMSYISLRIRSPDGVVECSKDDYVIFNRKKEVYTCMQHIFKKTYEPLVEKDSATQI